MEREAETESHDLHRIHRAYGHLSIWLSLMQRRAQQSLAHDGILAFWRVLQARHFFGKSRTCSSGKLVGCLSISPGCSWVLHHGFFHFRGGVGTQAPDCDGWLSVGTIAFSWWKRQLSVRCLFSFLVLETSALIEGSIPSPLNHHTHPGGGGRGQHAEGSLWTQY